MNSNQWRDRAKRLGDSVNDASNKAKQRIDESAPEVSRKLRQQLQDATPLVAHRVREVGKALKAQPQLDPSVQHLDLPTNRYSRSSVGVPVMPPSPTQAHLAYGGKAISPTHVPPLGTPAVASADPVVADRQKRPAGIHVAYMALGVAAICSAILAGMGVYGLTELRGSVDKVLHLDPTGTVMYYANGYVNNAETWLVSTAIGLGFVFTVAYALVSLAVFKAHRWPRPVGSVLAVVSIPVVFLGPVAVVIFVAGMVAVVALWIPSSRRYAVQARDARRMARAR